MQTRPATATLTPRPAIPPRLLAMPLVLAALIWLGMAFGARAQDDLIVTHGVSTFGELSYPADFTHLDYVNPDAPQGGELSFSWSSGSFDSIHPYTNIGNAAVLASVFFETMLEATSDTIGQSYGLLAETIAYPEDRSYVIFTIRDNARFSDGTPVTADDALFSYEILRDEGLPSFRASIPMTIAGAEVLDDQRIRFDFNPEAPLRGRIESAGGLPVFSRASHDASGLDFNESRIVPLVGSAPYVLDDIVPGQRVVLSRNRDYWGNDLPINRGRHNFDSIRVEYYGDAIAAFEGFTAGNYTFRQESSSVTWATAYDFPKLEQGIIIREELPDGTISSGQSFMINLREDRFADPRVREALTLMFNFDWTNATLFYGLYQQNISFWQNTDLAATGMPSEAELALLEPLRDVLPESVFTDAVFSVPSSDPERTLDRRAARAAGALLDAAGWEVGSDGMRRNAAGEPLTVEFLNASALFDRIINPYVENLRAIGVDASLNRVDPAQLSQRQRDQDFDIVTDHFPMGYEPGSSMRQYFGTLGADESLFNVPGLADEGVDRLLEIVIGAETQEDLTVAVSALDRVLRAKMIRVGQWYNPNHWVSYYDMYRYPETLPPYALGFLDFWWIDPEAEAALRAQGAF